MSQMSLDQTLALAKQHHRERQIESAETLYRRVLAVDPGHADALGSLATLLITIFLTGLVLFFSLRALSDQALRVAALLALLVLTPVFMLGAAILYVDQEARVESGPRPRRKRDADLHSAFESDGAGRSDTEGQP